MKLGVEVGLDPGHIVLDGDPAPSPRKGHIPQFLAHIRCGLMAGWIKMPLSMVVGVGPGDFVLDGDPARPSPKRGRSPQFSAHVRCGQTAGWIKMPLGVQVVLGPGHIVLDGDPSHSPQRGTSPNFRPIFVAAKWLDASRYHLVWW